VREIGHALAVLIQGIELVEGLDPRPERPGGGQGEERALDQELAAAAVAAVRQGHEGLHARAGHAGVEEGDERLVAVDVGPALDLDPLPAAEQVSLPDAQGPHAPVADLGHAQVRDGRPGVEGRDAHVHSLRAAARRGDGLDPRVAKEAGAAQVALGLRERLAVRATAGGHEQLAADHRLARARVQAIGEPIRPGEPTVALVEDAAAVDLDAVDGGPGLAAGQRLAAGARAGRRGGAGTGGEDRQGREPKGGWRQHARTMARAMVPVNAFLTAVRRPRGGPRPRNRS
jgi:hypothetical protein